MVVAVRITEDDTLQSVVAACEDDRLQSVVAACVGMLLRPRVCQVVSGGPWLKQ